MHVFFISFFDSGFPEGRYYVLYERKIRGRQTDRQTGDRLAGRQTDRQTDRQVGRQAGRETIATIHASKVD